MSTLSLFKRVTIFDDSPAHSNPQRRRPDWARNFNGVSVENAGGVPLTIDALQEATVFTGVRSLTANALTNYALANVPTLSTSRYRLTWGGAGTTPGFRTARALDLSGGNAVLTLQANQTVTVTSSLGAIFGSVVSGDHVYIPGVSTGDTALFDPLNDGLWIVLVAAAGGLTLGRPSGTTFSGATETVAVTAAGQFLAFTALGVQIGDTLDISAGFASSARRAYEIVDVTATRIDFVSTEPLGSETAVPGTAGLQIYSAAKRYVYIETDQEIAVKYNGATDETNRVVPLLPGDDSMVGFEEKFGTVYSLVIKNRSTERATLFIISAE